jgi:hypothetical protein
MPADWGPSFDAMPDADAAALIRAAYAAAAGQTVTIDAAATPTAAAFWPLLASAFERIRAAREEHVEQRRAAARSRWDKKGDAEKCGDHAEAMRNDAKRCGDHAEAMRGDAYVNVDVNTDTEEKETPLTGSKEKGGAFSLANAKKGGFKRWSEGDFRASVDEAIRQHPDLEEYREQFEAYWLEPDTRGRPRYQLEKTWQTAGRLATWRSRAQSRPVVKLRPAFNAADPSTWGGE